MSATDHILVYVQLRADTVTFKSKKNIASASFRQGELLENDSSYSTNNLFLSIRKVHMNFYTCSFCQHIRSQSTNWRVLIPEIRICQYVVWITSANLLQLIFLLFTNLIKRVNRLSVTPKLTPQSCNLLESVTIVWRSWEIKYQPPHLEQK